MTDLILPNVRKMFIPDPGYIIGDFDLAQADAQVVAWEADDDDLKALFRDPSADLHIENAKTIFGYCNDKRRKQAKEGVHACVDSQHEALTRNGWVSVSAIQDGEEILVCDSSSRAYFAPCAWHRQLTTTTMHHIQGQHIDQFVTYDHTLLHKTGSCQAWQLAPSHRVRKYVSLYQKAFWPKNFARLLAAFQADGTKAKRHIRFHLKKQRKIERLLTLCEQAGIPARKNGPYADGSYNITIPTEFVELLLSFGKEISWNLLSLGTHLDDYIDELRYWDGHVDDTSITISNKSREAIEILQTLQALCLRGGAISRGTRCWRLQQNNRVFARVTSEIHPNWTGAVYCPITPTGFWLTRRNGCISVTGNTNYGASARTLAAVLGITVHEAEMFQRKWFEAHPGIKEWHRLVERDLQTQRFITNKFGYRSVYFDRIEGLLPQALAWIPQSTVALVIDKGLVNVAEQLPQVEPLLQVHDSIVLQWESRYHPHILKRIKECLEIPVPYDDPLIIPVGAAVSRISWGDVVDVDWDGNEVGKD